MDEPVFLKTGPQRPPSYDAGCGNARKNLPRLAITANVVSRRDGDARSKCDNSAVTCNGKHGGERESVERAGESVPVEDIERISCRGHKTRQERNSEGAAE